MLKVGEVGDCFWCFEVFESWDFFGNDVEDGSGVVFLLEVVGVKVCDVGYVDCEVEVIGFVEDLLLFGCGDFLEEGVELFVVEDFMFLYWFEVVVGV